MNNPLNNKAVGAVVAGVVLLGGGIAAGMALSAPSVTSASVTAPARVMTPQPPVTTGMSAPTLPTPSTPTPPPSPQTDEQNYIPKSLGQEAGLGSGLGAPDATTFTIDKVTVDPKCAQYGTKPESGHTLVLQVRVATGSDPESAQEVNRLLSPYSFQEIGKDGVTRPAKPGSCTGYQNDLPTTFGPHQKYAGQVELSVPQASGILTMGNGQLANGPSGWVWHY